MAVETNIENTPFLKILPAVVTGIIVGEVVEVVVWVALVATLVAIVAAYLLRKRALWGSIYTLLALMLTALTATQLDNHKSHIPHGRQLRITAEVLDNPVTTSGGYLRYSIYADRWQEAEGGEWRRGGDKIVVITPPQVTKPITENSPSPDNQPPTGNNQISQGSTRASSQGSLPTPPTLGPGSRFVTTVELGPIGGEGFEGYAKLMSRRGYTASTFLPAEAEVLPIPPARIPTLRVIGARWQAAAAERLERLDIEPEAMATAKAMTIGMRSGISPSLRDEYSASGSSHLLAVSGLHVGIVALIINSLLYLLPLIRGGHQARNLIAIVAIWGYALLTGLSPATTRAAAMFSGAQIAYAASLKRSPMNILLATATIMLLLNPDNLFDISFLLSFAAVVGIALLYEPIYRIGASRIGALNLLWGMIAVGLAATLATAPLIAHTFGRLPIIGTLIAPAVVATAYLTILITLLWIAIPSGGWARMMGVAIEWVAGLQNRLVELSAIKWWASAEVELTAWGVVVIYIVALGAIIIYRKRRKPAKRKLYIR